MSIKAVIGFDHLPKGVTTWTAVADHGLVQLGTQVISGDGWAGSSSTAISRIGYPLAAYLPVSVAKVWIGVRIRFDAATSTAKPLVGMSPNTVSTTGTVILTSTDVRTVTGLTTIPAGTIGYFEFAINIATGVVERRYNGVDLSNVAITANKRDWLPYFEMTTTSNGGNVAFRDIYLNDDQGSVTGFLGPQIVKRIQFDSATGSGWTTAPTAGGDLIYGLDPVDSTKDISGVSKAPLIASLRPDLPAGITASAIEIVAALSSTIASVVTCGIKIKNGADEVVGANVVGQANGVVNYSGMAGVFALSPSGQPWTNATIDSTDVILTPDV